MKQKSKKLILLFIISLVMILGFATIVNAATLSLSKTTLELEEGKTETLTCTGTEEGATINWTSSDETIATVNLTGLVTAIKEGTTTITATVGEDTATCTVTVKTASSSSQEETVQWTDFSNAEYELTTNISMVNLNIKNVKTNENSRYLYCITSTNEKPKVEIDKNGKIDFEKNTNWTLFDGLNARIEEYVQLNQDMYLWICENIRLENSYKDDNNNYVEYVSKFVVTAQKLTRPKSPVYAELFRYTFMTYNADQIAFNIPYAKGTERNFTLKIGKITDKNILNGIKNNNGEAWNSLLDYAKKSNAVFNDKLTITEKYLGGYGGSESSGNVIKINGIEDKAYYFMYVVFDDENGKYYPQSGLTIAKANVNRYGEWDMFFLGDDKFKWDDFGTIQTGTATVDGNQVGTTKAGPTTLPYTGITTIGLVIVAMAGTAVFFKLKNNKYKGI